MTNHVVTNREHAKVRHLGQRLDTLHVVVVHDERVQAGKLFEHLEVAIVKEVNENKRQ